MAVISLQACPFPLFFPQILTAVHKKKITWTKKPNIYIYIYTHYQLVVYLTGCLCHTRKERSWLVYLEFALIKFIPTCFNLLSQPVRLRWNFTLSLTWVVTEQSKFAVFASLESDVAVMYRDDKKPTSQKRISPLYLAQSLSTRQRKKTGTYSQVGEDTKTNFVSELEKGLFVLLNCLFKLKWCKDESTWCTYQVSWPHFTTPPFAKTTTFFKHRKAKVISMKASEQQNSFHWAVKLSCCLMFRAMQKITERQGRPENKINWKIIITYYGDLPYPVQKTESTRNSMLPKSFANMEYC